MTQKPPLPAAAQTPFPLHPVPHEANGKPAFFASDTPASDTATERYTLADRLSLPEALSNNVIAIGAAIGLGVAALAGALFYRGRVKPEAKPTRRSRTAAKSPAKPSRSRAAKTTPPAKAASPIKGSAADGAYDVSYFARKHGLSPDEARAILAEAGADRTRANTLAKSRKD
jgi:hypothetical protein